MKKTIICLALLLTFLFCPLVTRAQVADSTCKGQWVFVDTVEWMANPADRAAFDTYQKEAVLSYEADGITFLALCNFPGEIINGGDSAFFPMGMSASDATFKEGYRFDSCWLAATPFGMENPHDLFLAPDGNYVYFSNRHDPEEENVVCLGRVWVDPIDPDNKGQELESKTALWRFPVGIRDGETLTVWFVDNGEAFNGAALGWRYIWKSNSGMQPLTEGTVGINAEYAGNTGAWVMKNYEVYPRGRSYDNESVQKDRAVYLDEESGKVTFAYLKSIDQAKDWGFFESIFDFPPVIITSQGASVNITTSSLGGYGNATSDGTSLQWAKNVDSWEDARISVKMWDEDDSRWYASVDPSGWMKDIFDSKTKAFPIQSFGVGNKAGDKLTLVYSIPHGSAIAFNYMWDEGVQQ